MTDPKTTDIVKQLRLWQRINLIGPLSQTASVCNGQVRDMIALGMEAADEIERLRAALREIAAMDGNPYPSNNPSYGDGYDMAASTAAEIAREALGNV